ncbi:MAG: galactokinase [Oscillospiraceae bacterium]|nr:galactokinase [Candidatus Equicaccousia limihippi]
MSIAQLKEKISSGLYDDQFALIYNDIAPQKERYLAACDEFLKIYPDGDARLFSAPGRTEVGGNHTDHQHGCVLAGSVDLDVIAVVCLNGTDKIRVKSKGYDMDEICINDLSKKDAEIGKARSLIRGMCAYFKEIGVNLQGFNAYTTSNVLKGSGLSSSAAFEVLIGNILKGLFDVDINDVEIAKLSQKTENVYFGKPSGLMDQMASSVGGFTAIDFKDNLNPAIEKVDFDLAGNGYSLCIVNTKGDHADLTDDYAAITAECEQISKYFGKNYLREVDENEFTSNIPSLRREFGDRAVLRAIHFFNDNKNAVTEKEQLKKGDFKGFLKTVTDSGNSSNKYLQNAYSSKNLSNQGINIALSLTERFLQGEGACRVHGGGFGGTIQAFVPNGILTSYKEYIEKIFGEDSCYVLNIRKIGGFIFKQR